MTTAKPRGPWGVRFLIRMLTVVLGVLTFWLLGFFMQDIESIPGPKYEDVERRHVDAAMVDKVKQSTKQIADLERSIADQRERQRLVGESSQNLQRTINQLLELQKLSLQKDVTLSAPQQESLSASLTGFLASQKDYQALNEGLSGLVQQKQALEEEKRRLEQQIEQQRVPARKEFDKLRQAHRWRLAAYQLLVLLPLLGGAGTLLRGRRGSRYFPLFLAFGMATLVKVGLVMHEYFPARCFKYLLIVGLLLVVGRLLLHFISMVVAPKRDWLARQYREAYERFLCPVCEYPIRTGPRRFLYWTRRTVHKILPVAGDVAETGPYTCPACGTRLFEACPDCQHVRHALLAHCEHCGAGKELP